MIEDEFDADAGVSILQTAPIGDLVLSITEAQIRAAVRRYPWLRQRRPGAVALVVPDQTVELYLAAALAVFRRWASPKLPPSCQRAIRLNVHKRGNWDRTSPGEQVLAEAMAAGHSVVAITDQPDDISEHATALIDGVVTIGAPDPRLVRAALRQAYDGDPTHDEVAMVRALPLPDLRPLVRWGRPLADLMERVIKTTERLARENAEGADPSTGEPQRVVTEPVVPSLDDLHGLGEAAVWGKELAVDLADWKRGALAWAHVDRGVLISGPPGTGKTTYARALAKTCDVPVVIASLARWQSKGHLGDLLKAMRKDFATAIDLAPAILFIDEIDAVGDRERFDNHNMQYCTEVVAALLECLDGAEAREGVVVVGACNHPGRIDRAIVRAGRLDRHVRIGLPDGPAREGILRWHLKGALAGADLSEIVATCDGASGADLERVVRDGRRLARRDRRAMTLVDLTSNLPERVTCSEAQLWRIAVHEAGHALLIHALDRAVIAEVRIERTFTVVNGARRMQGGGVSAQLPKLTVRTRQDHLDEIAVMLGGLSAEEAIIGERSDGSGGGPGSDLGQATAIAATLEISLGLGQSLSWLMPADQTEDAIDLVRRHPVLHREVESTLQAQARRAREIVEARREDLLRLARALVESTVMSGAEVRDVLGAADRLPEKPTEVGSTASETIREAGMGKAKAKTTLLAAGRFKTPRVI